MCLHATTRIRRLFQGVCGVGRLENDIRRGRAHGLQWYACGAIHVWSLIALGCSGGVSGESFDRKITSDHGEALQVVADWSDVDPAINVSLQDGEVAIVPVSLMGPRFAELSPWLRVYELRSITDASGSLFIARDWTVPPDPRGSVVIVVRAELDGSRLGDDANRLERGIARRLVQLAGVETAPMFEQGDTSENQAE